MNVDSIGRSVVVVVDLGAEHGRNARGGRHDFVSELVRTPREHIVRVIRRIFHVHQDHQLFLFFASEFCESAYTEADSVPKW